MHAVNEINTRPQQGDKNMMACPSGDNEGRGEFPLPGHDEVTRQVSLRPRLQVKGVNFVNCCDRKR